MEERLGRDKGEKGRESRRPKGEGESGINIPSLSSTNLSPSLFPSGVIRHPGEGVQREEKTLRT